LADRRGAAGPALNLIRIPFAPLPSAMHVRAASKIHQSVKSCMPRDAQL
jgi:hypothetical protein